ncbi:ABC transporter permease [Actinophytocola gossypii]|uniref:ABC transporter permease n=1 Tax=Actinophytocola gossypii TaxID=2812003 RepID=A0ABT2JC35_9PSEU|nr:ABC transporter permease [Actinophytocola gossypii]MCT2585426.1 ABC transporter permease [Actinophytocola gossypii]
MSRWTSGWRPALRIARRSVRRNLKRSILIAALIAVPIAGATVIDGMLRTMSGAEHNLYQAMGTADGLAQITGQHALPDWRPGMSPYGMHDPTAETERDPAAVDLLGMLPPGSRAVPEPKFLGVQLTEGDRIVRTDLMVFAVGDPLTEHRARIVAGRAPDDPAEAVVTKPLADRLGLLTDDGDGLRPGATITVDDGRTATVSGMAVNPLQLDQQAVLTRPGSTMADAGVSFPEMVLGYYVDLPDGVDPDSVWPVLAEHGVTFTPREVHTQPERYPALMTGGGDFLETAGPVALVVLFGVLEVVLLAGAAFAVGARRQVRELGLIGANGGTSKHVRRTVLAQGLFLGTIGALAGLVLGWLVLVAGTPLWQRLTNELVDGWRFGWIELVVAAAVGVLSGLGAALVPAIGVARMRPVDALAQRFRSTAMTARLPVLGVVLLGVGIGGVVVSGLLARQVMADYQAMLEQEGAVYTSPDVMLPTVGAVLGGLAMVVGVIMVSSGLLGALGRFAARLPLSARLAVRDAGRHRHRTVPAVAAIMIVVAGAVAMSFGLAAGRSTDFRSQPENTVIVEGDPMLSDGDEQLATGAGDVAAELPGGEALEITMLSGSTPTPDGGPTPVAFGSPDSTSPRCDMSWAQAGIATPKLIELATGSPPSPAALAALDRGEVLVLDECLFPDDATTGAVSTEADEEAERVTLPGRLLEPESEYPYYQFPAVFVSAETAAEHGWTPEVGGYVVTHDPTATQDDIDTALAAAEDNGLNGYVNTDESAEIQAVSLGLAGGAGLVTLLGVGITVALSAAESRADLATLAAVGAQPRRRRLLAGAQGLVISGMGTVLGLVVGAGIGFVVVPLSGDLAFPVPWESLAVTVVAVPLLAVLVSMLSTRSNLPMVRRVD